MMSKVFIAALAPVFLTLSCQAANAADAPDHPTLRVHAGDLDLRKPADRTRLNQRLYRAAEAVCPQASLLDLPAMRYRSECMEAALRGTDQAVAALVDRAAQRNTVLARTELR